jgi:glycosyltransferase involved in cell wall biosynthesis
VSVVIPTFNEASRLPVLLEHLARQSRQPDEIIVADADSTDGTADIARAAGATVVHGGNPSAGRNAGAAAASCELIMFMDADGEPEADFMQKALAEFDRRHLGMATAPIRAIEPGIGYRIAFAAYEAYMRLVQGFSPHAMGPCMLVERELHERMGGFDESLALAEDAEYARRAARYGKYGLLRSVRVPTLMRRVHRVGLRHTAWVIFWSELRNLANVPIRRLPFSYEFGVVDDATPVGVPGQGARLSRARRMLRELGKPSTELQGDLVGIHLVSIAAGVIGVGVLAGLGTASAVYLPLAAVATVFTIAFGYAALRKNFFRRSYGDFFSAGIAVASDDVVDASGTTLIRSGVDQVCEIHAIGHLGRMARLNREGLAGRLTVILEILEGLQSLAGDIDDPFYRDVTYVIGRSDMTAALLKNGFVEIVDPPPFDLFNRVEKHVLMWVISIRGSMRRTADSDSYRMAVLRKDVFAGPEMRAAIDMLVSRARQGVERARRIEASGRGAE